MFEMWKRYLNLSNFQYFFPLEETHKYAPMILWWCPVAWCSSFAGEAGFVVEILATWLGCFSFAVALSDYQDWLYAEKIYRHAGRCSSPVSDRRPLLMVLWFRNRMIYRMERYQLLLKILPVFLAWSTEDFDSWTDNHSVV